MDQPPLPPPMEPVPSSTRKSEHFNLSDSIGIGALVVSLVLWIMLPTFFGRLCCSMVAVSGIILLGYKSHWTHSFPSLKKHFIALIVGLLLALFLGWQLLNQWKDEHTFRAIILPGITWPQPLPIGYGTPLSARELNARATVPGTFVYNPTFGATPQVGTDTLSVAFTPTDLTKYAVRTATVALVVRPSIVAKPYELTRPRHNTQTEPPNKTAKGTRPESTENGSYKTLANDSLGLADKIQTLFEQYLKRSGEINQTRVLNSERGEKVPLVNDDPDIQVLTFDTRNEWKYHYQNDAIRLRDEMLAALPPGNRDDSTNSAFDGNKWNRGFNAMEFQIVARELRRLANLLAQMQSGSYVPAPTISASPLVQDIHRPQQDLIASIIRSGIPANEHILVFAPMSPKQVDDFARHLTAALQLGGMKAELSMSNELRPGVVIVYDPSKKAYADVLVDAFTKAQVPGPIIEQSGSPPAPLTIVIGSTD